MKKSVLCVLCIYLSIAASLSSAAQLSFTTGDWRPYIHEVDGTIDKVMPGFSIEIVNAAFANMGHSISYVAIPFRRQLEEVKLGKYDALVGLYRDEAPTFIFPEEAIAMTRNCFYTVKGNTWMYENPQSLTDVDIAVVSGYTYGEIDSYIASGNERVIKLTGSETNMMKRLTSLVSFDRATAFVQDSAVADYYFSTEGIADNYQQSGCLESIEAVIGFSPVNPDHVKLARDFDIQVRAMRASGELQKILDKYGASDWK